MGRNGKWALAAMLAAGGGFGIARGQDTFSAPNCTDVSQANFNKVLVLDQTKDPNLDEVTRFTVTANQLDMSSEKVILSWPTQKNYCCHTGGDIRIDGKGDLWISVGNNTLNAASGDADSTAYIDTRYADADDEGHSANSNDL